MNDVTIAKILDNNEISKRVKNKKRINDFEKNKINYITSIYDNLRNDTYIPHKYNIFLIKEPKYRIIMSWEYL